MALTKTPHWTDLYYNMVGYYFWEPQRIGRISDSSKKSQPWNYWKEKLQDQETPLNHIMDLLFHVAPQELLDNLVSTLLKRAISGLDLVAAGNVLDASVVQPDIILSNGTDLVFIEMKVDSKSSIDQFAKYAIAAHCIIQDEPELKSVDLIILSRHTEHEKVWKNSKKHGLTNAQAVRDLAHLGLNNDDTVWTEKGVQRYTKSFPNSIPDISNYVNKMGLHLDNYETLEHVLVNFASKEKTSGRLIQGVLHEFSRRQLIQQNIVENSPITENYPTTEQIDTILSFLPLFEGENLIFSSNTAMDQFSEFYKALYENNFVYSFDWSIIQKDAESYFEQPELLHTADLETIRKLFTFHARKDRFCDGHFQDMIKSGFIKAMLQRVKELKHENA